MEFQVNYPLSQLTSFHVGGAADYFVIVRNLDELKQALQFGQEKNLPALILGGGSNVLVADAGFRGLVIQIELKGIGVAEEGADFTVLKIAAGEIWDAVVDYAVQKNLWGIENLSFIPGKTGAIPIQNVGAYGQEASIVLLRAEVLNIKKNSVEIWQNQDFNFAYRQSRLNQDLKNHFAVLNIYLKLSKTPKPNLAYVDLKNHFGAETNPSLGDIRQAVGEIRSRKFPKIEEMGSDGSFFKNLLLDVDQVKILDEKIRQNFSAEVFDKYVAVKNKFPTPGATKIPAAFLIDICELKGRTFGGARLWENQPLVIVNTGTAKASDIAGLFKAVRQEVYAKTGMTLTNEPEFVGFGEQELNTYFNLNV